MSQKESYAIARTFRRAYKYEDSDRIITLIHNDPQYPREKFPEVKEHGVVNGYLKKLKIFCDVPNLPELPVPDVPDYASQAQAYAIQKEVEWHSARFGIMLWVSKEPNPSDRPSDKQWILVGYHSVINTGIWRQYDSYPVFSDNLADELEEGDRIGISIQAVSYQGTIYFPRLNPPYTLPENRPDQITFDVGWLQDLVVAKPAPQPLVVYVTQTSSGANTTTQKTPPVSKLTPPTGVTNQLTVNKNQIAINVSNLDLNSDFVLQWFKTGTTQALQSNTYKSDASGNYNSAILTSDFVNPPFSGSGVYYFTASQGTLSAESNKVTIKHFSAIVPATSNTPNTIIVNPGYSWSVRLYDITDNQQVTLQILRNGVLMPDWATTPNLKKESISDGTVYWVAINLPVDIFSRSNWGYGGSLQYNVRATVNGVVSESSIFLTQYITSYGAEG